jgi:hypothetical protein
MRAERALERLRTSTSSNCTVFIYFDGAAAGKEKNEAKHTCFGTVYLFEHM